MLLTFALILPWMLIAAGIWLGYQIVRQNGRILIRLDAMEAQLRPRADKKRRDPAGLTIGTAAPEFELPDLNGERRKLTDFRGRELLLLFFNPNCGFCTAMADELAALDTTGENGHAVPLVVTTGDAEENRQLLERHGIGCTVLLQEQMETASRFRAQGTPMGYRIDVEGRIASELTVGAEALLKLAGPKPPGGDASKSARNDRGHAKQPDASLSRSRLKRDGLKAGEPAPDFRLPRLDGAELSLSDFRGERVLLVFSDPDCGPCMELAPRLQELHVQRSDVRIVMVSRREVEANRAKAEELELTFPIVLQRQWEVSRDFGMFATPIGYLIDEHGLLASDVAVGVEPILALAGVERQPNLSNGQLSGRDSIEA